MTSERPNYGTLSIEQRRRLANAVLTKIRNAGSVYTPEARMVFGIFEQAAKDWLGLSTDATIDGARSAAIFLRGRGCESYLGLIGIDHGWAMEKLAHLKVVT